MQHNIQQAVTPGFWRRVAAIFYDSWLVVAIWLVGITVDTFVRDPQGMAVEISHLPVQLFVLLAPALFFGWFWTHGGQTLGMRAWRLRLLADDGDSATWRQAMLRYLGALLSLAALGLGYVWILIDKDRLAWHDRLSSTRLVLVAKD